jgi:hypothetical protein
MRGLRQPHAHAKEVDGPSAFEMPPSSPPSAPHAPATGRLQTTSAGAPCFHFVAAIHLRHALSIPSASLPKKTETGNQRRCRFHHWLADGWVVAMRTRQVVASTPEFLRPYRQNRWLVRDSFRLPLRRLLRNMDPSFSFVKPPLIPRFATLIPGRSSVLGLYNSLKYSYFHDTFRRNPSGLPVLAAGAVGSPPLPSTQLSPHTAGVSPPCDRPRVLRTGFPQRFLRASCRLYFGRHRTRSGASGGKPRLRLRSSRV